MINKHFTKKRLSCSRGQGHRFFGIVLAAIGFVWLAKKVGWIPVAVSGLTILWPIVIMVLGVFIILHANNEKRRDREQDPAH
jgi:hypothetical protein